MIRAGYCYLDPIGVAGSRYNYVSPDFYRLAPWEGRGFKPMGYGYDSVAASLETMRRIEAETAGLPEEAALTQRRAAIREIDLAGIIATPANSSINELVVEDARMSILADGEWVNIVYETNPHVEKRTR